ncbi:DUF3741-associated sequence motif protein [Artemisia annua]|uniref:DUF3741-associated sequence motif protein n=1 Tax=Artemisia annua TaxID=35608 RepID=A0A2U1MXU6_ARTAN|nr:DUF3741-associated sequence motif protein [Artemisia annua]
MKFFQSSSSHTQFSDFKCATGYCLPKVLCRLPCFHGLVKHHRIKELPEPCCAITNPGVVAKLMGLDPIPQGNRAVNCQEHRHNLSIRSQPISRSPMVLKVEKRKFCILGAEAERGKADSISSSKRKLLEDDRSKKKKLVTETSNIDRELEFYDQLLLELVYIF